MKNRYIFLFVPVLLGGLFVTAKADDSQYNFAGSVQLDYLAIPTQTRGQDATLLDGATTELSLKFAFDFDDHVSANVKVCYACHGFEIGMAFFDMRVSDELNFRVGRFTPAFGNFPLRHDPANHRTSDKPLPYDMGRMLRLREWNMSVLPAPWVDNGVEVNGTRFFGDSRLDYAAYAIGGPKGANDAFDFDYIESRSPGRYYVDNNSEPTVGARLAFTTNLENVTASVGGSGMAGRYDPDRDLSFWLVGVDVTVQVARMFFRGEYLLRRTEFDVGSNPEARLKFGPGEDGEYDNFFLKDGFYLEAEAPLGRLELVGRWDGMRRIGNVSANSPLRRRSAIFRYTLAAAYRLMSGVRIKASAEYYDFSDFEDDLAFHFGVTSAF